MTVIATDLTAMLALWLELSLAGLVSIGSISHLDFVFGEAQICYKEMAIQMELCRNYIDHITNRVWIDL